MSGRALRRRARLAFSRFSRELSKIGARPWHQRCINRLAAQDVRGCHVLIDDEENGGATWLELNCSRYQLQAASISHSADGTVFRCSCGPLSDDRVAAVHRAARDGTPVLAGVPRVSSGHRRRVRRISAAGMGATPRPRCDGSQRNEQRVTRRPTRRKLRRNLPACFAARSGALILRQGRWDALSATVACPSQQARRGVRSIPRHHGAAPTRGRTFDHSSAG